MNCVAFLRARRHSGRREIYDHRESRVIFFSMWMELQMEAGLLVCTYALVERGKKNGYALVAISLKIAKGSSVCEMSGQTNHIYCCVLLTEICRNAFRIRIRTCLVRLSSCVSAASLKLSFNGLQWSSTKFI